MKHFPIFLAMEGQKLVLSGGGDAALAKLRLLLKTEARIEVFTADPAPEIVTWPRVRWSISWTTLPTASSSPPPSSIATR